MPNLQAFILTLNTLPTGMQMGETRTLRVVGQPDVPYIWMRVDGVNQWVEFEAGGEGPSGPAGGVLGGTYPNPAFAVDMATQAELDAVATNTPSSGEKAGLAGTSGTPGSGNKYVTDADARNTNARTPSSTLAHKTTHQDGGTDEITVLGLSGLLADGQTPLAHAASHAFGSTDVVTLTEAQITNLTTDLAAKALASRLISTTAPVTGGGDLSADRTIAVSAATTSVTGVVELATDGEVAANVVVQGNDSRNSNARTPTAHKTTHQDGGTDEISVLGLSGLLADQQTPTLTGTMTALGAGATDNTSLSWTVLSSSFSATIVANAITNARLADVASATIKGRVTALTGDPEDLTGTQVTTLLDVFTSVLKGLVPASGGGTTTFLRADGAFAAPPAVPASATSIARIFAFMGS